MRRQLWDDVSDAQHFAEIDAVLNNQNSWCYVARGARGAYLGFAEICIRDYANGCTEQPVPFLEGIWIDAQHRRSGVGRMIIDKTTQDLIDAGFKELCSDAFETNHHSHRAHENWGFEETMRVIYFRKVLE